MKTRTLGSRGIEVSALASGCMGLECVLDRRPADWKASEIIRDGWFVEASRSSHRGGVWSMHATKN